ncbi:MAG: hypothetical protein GF399_06890 [Candidatus Coatesbacteria bacterium]|nr:hypothetical protein [Candidatus Coatesbacteria bacterium]
MSTRWNDESTLDELRRRLESSDLIPSQRPLLEELAARLVLLAAGYGSPDAVAAAEPATLHAAVVEANADSRFYRGKVGLRDIRRLVAAAAYLAD